MGGKVVKVIFLWSDGARQEIGGYQGETIMDCAVDNQVPGISAQCGGACNCATCHCYVTDPWFARVGAAQGDEADILGFTPGRQRNSRLSCQLVLTEQLDGIAVVVPD